MIAKREIRQQLGELLAKLYELDHQVLDLCESLPLPPDAAEMWEIQIPTNFTVNVYSALESVRVQCIAEAIMILQRASAHNDTSLRSAFFQQEHLQQKHPQQERRQKDQE